MRAQPSYKIVQFGSANKIVDYDLQQWTSSEAREGRVGLILS